MRRSAVSFSFIAVLALSSTFGCTPEDAGPAAASENGAEKEKTLDATTPGKPAAPTPDDPAPATDDLYPEGKSGWVFVNTLVQQSVKHQITAFFSPVNPFAEGCTIEREGSCAVVDCTSVKPLPPNNNPNAGEITVTGGDLPAAGLLLQPSVNGLYPGSIVMPADGGWSPGDALSIKAEGAAVGSFNRTITAPPLVTLTSPAPADPKNPAKAAEVTRGADFPVAWTGGSATSSILAQMTTYGDARIVDLRCRFPGTAGSGTVPGKLTSKLLSHPKNALMITGGEHERLTAGDYTIAIDVGTLAAGRGLTVN